VSGRKAQMPLQINRLPIELRHEDPKLCVELIV